MTTLHPMDINFETLLQKIAKAPSNQHGNTQLRQISLEMRGYMVATSCQTGLHDADLLSQFRTLFDSLNGQSETDADAFADFQSQLTLYVNEYQAFLQQHTPAATGAPADISYTPDTAHLFNVSYA